MINQIVCTSAGGNTGIPDCALTLKNTVMGFLVPGAFELTAAQLLTPEATLAALSNAAGNDNPSLRIYPLPEAVGVTDNSEDVTLQTFGYGAAVPVRDGNYNLTYAFTRGGNCVNNTLQKFNGQNYRFIGVDASGVLYGTKVTTSTGTVFLKGIPLDYFYAMPFKHNDGSNVTGFAWRISYKPVYVNSGLGFIQLPLVEVLNISGLLNINIVLPTPRVTNVIKVKTLTGCAGVDLYDQYSGSLVTASNWIVTRNGANVGITGVALDANLKAFTITLDATDPDYNVAGPFVVSMAAPSILTTNGIAGYEGLALTVA